ncbi:uncharacterized protein LOC128725502 [Anopheles nili]|uniref:uncharacterized protein LOC128725502 n=1 Tax=Anopheles nili TaxID=185578 RepID=UPI00237B1E44|nr:uncharacterized protein LOC128725502 [Anopheles nili]
MKSLAVVCMLVSVYLLHVEAFYNRNSFDIIAGCKQHDHVVGYDGSVQYFPTTNLANVGRTSNSKYFRIAVLGANDGIIRFGESLFPYDRDVVEIVLGGWGNTRSAGRRQRRSSANRYSNTVLSETSTPKLLSEFHATMFVLEVFNNGTVQVKKDGQLHPFLSFFDINRIPVNYMALTRWDKQVIYFYDCPLEPPRNCTTP